MKFELQADVFRILLVTLLLAIAIIYLAHKLKKADPLEKPKGILVPFLMAMEKMYNDAVFNVGEKHADKFAPYITVLFAYIITSNFISLFGISSPTANLSVTLTLAIITWVMTQAASVKYSGLGAWFKSLLDPIPILLPINILSKFSSILSMSIRLFGNILCGSIMMSLIYSGCGALSNAIAGLFGASNVFNFMAPIIAPVLHAYFDLFAGYIQTLVFVTLTMVFIGMEIPDEMKKSM